MRIHESGIDLSPDTPSKSTMPSTSLTPLPCAPTATSSHTPSAHCAPTTFSPTHILWPSAPTTTISVADTGTTDFSCPHCPAPSPHAPARSVTSESITQRLANQCLMHQPIVTASISTARTALAIHVPHAYPRKPSVDKRLLHHTITAPLTIISLHIIITYHKHPIDTSCAIGKCAP
ncbi:hypothetical protein SprV_0401413600 [Sparganum proliferum]